MLARRRECLVIAVEHGLVRLGLLPVWMLRRQGRDPIHGESDLEVDRLLGPQRAVVVEDGDALLGQDVVGAFLGGDALHEIQDRLLGRGVVPGGQGIGLCVLRDGSPDSAGGDGE